jgi:hypothetical protein
MKKLITGIAAVVFSMGIVAIAAGISDTASHTVTITMPNLDLIAISGTPGTLTIAEPATLSESSVPMYSNEDTSSKLLWLTNQSGRKVTAELDAALPTDLKLLVTVTPTAGKGTTAGEVELIDTTAKNVVTGISKVLEWDAEIKYRASATAEVEPTTETPTVTYTITN